MAGRRSWLRLDEFAWPVRGACLSVPLPAGRRRSLPRQPSVERSQERTPACMQVDTALASLFASLTSRPGPSTVKKAADAFARSGRHEAGNGRLGNFVLRFLQAHRCIFPAHPGRVRRSRLAKGSVPSRHKPAAFWDRRSASNDRSTEKPFEAQASEADAVCCSWFLRVQPMPRCAQRSAQGALRRLI